METHSDARDQPQAAQSWLLQFTSADPRSDTGDGRPWGDGTAMAARAYAGAPPWDEGNAVAPMVGGFAAMNAIRDAFESAITDAEKQADSGVPPGKRGHVYIADWQFNALRDTSVSNPWGGGPWNPDITVTKDQTALRPGGPHDVGGDRGQAPAVACPRRSSGSE